MHHFERRVATLYLLTPLIAALLYLALLPWFPFDTIVPAGLFLKAQAPECIPERREHFVYLCLIALPPALFVALSWFKHPGASLRTSRVARGMLLFFIFAMWHYQNNKNTIVGYKAVSLTILAVTSLIWLVKKYPPQKALPSWLGWAVAAIFTTVELLPSFQTELTVPHAFPYFSWHLPFMVGEFAAIWSGHTAWVDFFPQYQTLFPYFTIPVFHLFGFSISTLTGWMCVLAWICLMAIYTFFVQLTRSSIQALGLYLPFIAMCFYSVMTDGNNRSSPFTYFSIGPLRYFGPFLTLLFLFRYIQKPHFIRLLTLGLIAALSAINNMDFGLTAWIAALAAVIATDRKVLRPALTFGSTLIATFALLGLYTWLRSGQMLDFSRIGFFQKVYAINGFGTFPLPYIGPHWLIYFTWMGCLLCALKDLFENRDKALAGAMIFVPVFGFGSAMYYVNRSHPDVLTSFYPTATLGLMLLVWRHLQLYGYEFSRKRFAMYPISALLFIAYCIPSAKIMDFASPFKQLERIHTSNSALLVDWDRKLTLLRQHTTPGESVVIIYPYGHLLATRAGIINRFPFVQDASLIITPQIDSTIDALERHHVSKVFGEFPVEFETALKDRGFKIVEISGGFRFWNKSGT